MTPARDGARELRDLDAVIAAIDHPVRRHVLVVLHARGGEMAAGAIAERFSCTWATASRHVQVLLRAGLLRLERRGRGRYYSLERDRFQALRRWMDHLQSPSPPPP